MTPTPAHHLPRASRLPSPQRPHAASCPHAAAPPPTPSLPRRLLPPRHRAASTQNPDHCVVAPPPPWCSRGHLLRPSPSCRRSPAWPPSASPWPSPSTHPNHGPPPEPPRQPPPPHQRATDGVGRSPAPCTPRLPPYRSESRPRHLPDVESREAPTTTRRPRRESGGRRPSWLKPGRRRRVWWSPESRAQSAAPLHPHDAPPLL